MKEFNVKILSFNDQNADQNAAICTTDKMKDIDDQAIFYSGVYSELFSTTRKNAKREQKLLSIVKIQYNGKTIHRRIQSSRFVKGVRLNDVGLSSFSISLLADDQHPVVGEKVLVSKGSKFAYYWYHHSFSTRASFRIGIFSFFVSILATIISCVSLFCCTG